jgi:outer membrane protein OmpA-like peptidoglycan-associated protein
MYKALLYVLLLLPLTAKCQDITITPEGMEIMSVYFAGGSYYIDDAQKRKVHDWLNGKEDLHEYEIMLHSHTDNIGTLSYNQFLSKMRSEETLRALEEIMIPREDVRVQDFGELNPLFDNTTLNGRLNNRRVDIILAPPSS